MGDAAMFEPVWNRHKYLPVLASSATRFPSRVAAKSTPPAVAMTPLLRDPWLILKSQTVLPVSGSRALIPAEGGGSFGPGLLAPPACPRPIYCRPGSYVTGALAYL